MSVYVPFDDQRKQDASFTMQSMGIQLGINVGTAALVMLGFSFLRPVCILFDLNASLLIHSNTIT
jgi:hypothetical protein